jgi:hypothetical protein
VLDALFSDAQMMSPGHSFTYRFEVPEDPRAAMAGRIWDRFGNDRQCLLGPAPVLTWEEYIPEPWKLYARVAVTAIEKRGARAASISFTVERGILKILQPGDLLYLNGNSMIGLSILRGDDLIAAAGAATGLSYIPVGSDVDVRIPGDLIGQAEAIFRTRDPEYRMVARPVEIAIAGTTRITRWDRSRMGSYEVFIRASVRDRDPCVSIERLGVCPETAAHTSAQLLDQHPYQIVRSRSSNDEEAS